MVQSEHGDQINKVGFLNLEKSEGTSAFKYERYGTKNASAEVIADTVKCWHNFIASYFCTPLLLLLYRLLRPVKARIGHCVRI